MLFCEMCTVVQKKWYVAKEEDPTTADTLRKDESHRTRYGQSSYCLFCLICQRLLPLSILVLSFEKCSFQLQLCGNYVH